MKKVFFVSALAVVISTGFSSCKKDWVCQCTDQNGNGSSHVISNKTLLDARSACKSLDYNYTAFGITTSNSCGLK